MKGHDIYMTRAKQLKQIQSQAKSLHRKIMRLNNLGNVFQTMLDNSFDNDQIIDSIKRFAKKHPQVKPLQTSANSDGWTTSMDFTIITGKEGRAWRNEDPMEAFSDHGGDLILSSNPVDAQIGEGSDLGEYADDNFTAHKYYKVFQGDDSDESLPEGMSDSGCLYYAEPVSDKCINTLVSNVKQQIHGVNLKHHEIPNSIKRQIQNLKNRAKLVKLSNVQSRLTFYIKLHPTATVRGITTAINLNAHWQKAYPKAKRAVEAKGLNITKIYNKYSNQIRKYQTLDHYDWSNNFTKTIDKQQNRLQSHVDLIKNVLYRGFTHRGNHKYELRERKRAMSLEKSMKNLEKSANDDVHFYGLEPLKWNGKKINSINHELSDFIVYTGYGTNDHSRSFKGHDYKYLGSIYSRYTRFMQTQRNKLTRQYNHKLNVYLRALRKAL